MPCNSTTHNSNLVIENYDARRRYLSENNNPNSIKLIHTNIRSLSKNFEELESVLHKLHHEFEIIVLTECWNLQDKNLFELEGYKIHYNNSRLNQNDGVVMYIKS